MGELIKMTCQECGREYDGRMGHGLQHAKLESVKEFFEEEIQNTLVEYAERNPFALFEFGFRPICCEGCGDIVDLPVLSLVKEGVRYWGKCPKCQRRIEDRQLNKELQCPKCHSHKIKTQRVGHWD